MKTKIVYVLTDGGNGSFAVLQELSLYTLEKRMKRVHDWEVFTVMDANTHHMLELRNSPILSKSTPVIVPIPAEYNQKERSRFLKTSLREIIHGDFLYLDGDTLIADRLDDIDNIDPQTDIALVTDGNGNYTVDFYKHVDTLCTNSGFTQLKQELCFNSGVSFVRDTPASHVFFKTWHDCWKQSCRNNVPFDQPALWEANRITGHKIQKLSGIWNCQFTAREPTYLPYVRKAKILHYYKTSYQGRLLLSIIDRMNDRGQVTFFDAMLLRWPQSLVYLRQVAMFIQKQKERLHKRGS